MNRVRVAHGLTPLHLDSHLATSARKHTKWMLRSGQFTHGNFGWRITHSGAPGPTYGENLAWGCGLDARADTIVREWLASPDHRANLLRPGFRRIGVSAAYGAFAGTSSAVVVTADFSGR